MVNYRFIIVCFSVLLACSSLSAQHAFVFARHLTYSIVYDYTSMTPAIVAWQLSEPDFRGTLRLNIKHFKMDTFLPPPRLKNSVFTKSGYTRGHLCPSGDRDGRKDWFRDTYYTSNIVPMTAEVNAGAWKETEVFCRFLASSGHPLRLAAGPILDDSSRERNTTQSLLVPTFLWKIARCTVHPLEQYAWLIPNVRTYSSHSVFMVQPDSIYTQLDQVISNYCQSWIGR